MILAREEARTKWDQAARKAFWDRLLTNLGRPASSPLDFNEISQRLHLRTAIYRGLQNVPLEKIVGSIGRYQDFTGAFLPISTEMGGRWQRVASLYLDPGSGGPPPIELYKVGDSYFVKDGNHRVSVAHQLDLTDIEAYVWEYPEPVAGVSEDLDIDALLLESERQDFLAQTNLDELRPRHNIRLTVPGGYLEILAQITAYQDALSRIDGEKVSWSYAVKAWYDMQYEVTIQIIEDAGVMRLFADRTPADFYVWMMRYQQNLEQQYGQRAHLSEIARQVPRQHRPGVVRRGWQAVLKLLSDYLTN